MDLGQTLRRRWRDLRARLAGVGARFPKAAGTGPSQTWQSFRRDHRWGLWARVALIVALVLLVVYPLDAWFTSHIDDDPDFGPPPAQLHQAGSRAVASATALIDLEVNQRGWTANAPWFTPTALLDNMPNYQSGMVEALGRFAFELTDQIGRARGSSEADKDLQIAAGLLQYPPDVWVWSPSVSIWPTATSQSQYRKAIKALEAYNARLASGQATFDARADNLQYTLARMAADLGSSSAVIEQHIRQTSGFPLETHTDDVFYTVKGQMYAYYIVLKGLEVDFAPIIKQRNLQQPWANMMESFRSAVALRPLVVLDGAPDSDFFPCTLCGEGFYLLRARTQLREITNILQQ